MLLSCISLNRGRRLILTNSTTGSPPNTHGPSLHLRLACPYPISIPLSSPVILSFECTVEAHCHWTTAMVERQSSRLEHPTDITHESPVLFEIDRLKMQGRARRPFMDAPPDLVRPPFKPAPPWESRSRKRRPSQEMNNRAYLVRRLATRHWTTSPHRSFDKALELVQALVPLVCRR